MQVDFYHLAASPIERILFRIAERVTGGGGRLLVVAEDEAMLDALDRALWTIEPASFVPHGRDGADQPVLLAQSIAAPANGARTVALADGVWREEALDYDRAFFLFTDAGITSARAAWRQLADRDGVARRFWRQDESGRWREAG